jgi:hypothetical protein
MCAAALTSPGGPGRPLTPAGQVRTNPRRAHYLEGDRLEL